MLEKCIACTEQGSERAREYCSYIRGSWPNLGTLAYSGRMTGIAFGMLSRDTNVEGHVGEPGRVR